MFVVTYLKLPISLIIQVSVFIHPKNILVVDAEI